MADELEDDGIGTRRTYEIDALLNGRTSSFSVAASAFPSLNWSTEKLGAGAIVEPGFGQRDRARVAIQRLSSCIAQRHVYTHLGWRNIEGSWYYLHAGGAIGQDGQIGQEALSTRCQSALEGYALPEPLDGDAQKEAVRASRELWALGRPAIVIPVWAAVFRSVLGASDFSHHLAGETGTFKTELAAVAQQHFGAGMNARNLPAAWSSTENYLEGLAFLAKDTLLVIDEFVPRGGINEVQRAHAKADRVLRAQGNRSGRGRMRQDGSVPSPKPPRGTILSTGEEAPSGQSLSARVLIIEVSPGDIDAADLTIRQQHAAAGLYAQAMAGFIQWLAPRYQDLSSQLASRVRTLRDELATASQHRRTPAIAADLVYAVELFLDFAVDAGAISVGEQARDNEIARRAILAAADLQARHQAGADPARRYLQLLSQSLASGRGHLAASGGEYPVNPAAWGWRKDAGSDDRWRAQGDCIGWLEGEDTYLIPDPAYQCAKRLGGETGEGVTIGPKALHKRLQEKGLLVTHGGERGAPVRQLIRGIRRNVLHLRSRDISSGETAQSAQTGQEAGPERSVSVASSSVGQIPWADSEMNGPESALENCPPNDAATLSAYRDGQFGQIGQFSVGCMEPVYDNVFKPTTGRESREVYDL